jgi:Rod binding domain-containing protein
MSELGIPSGAILPGGLADLLSGRGVSSPKNARNDMQKIEAAKDFESVLLHRLLGEMRRTIPESGLLSNGISKQLEDIFWLYLAREMADKGGLGLWKELYRKFGQLEGGAGAEAPAGSGRSEPSVARDNNRADTGR